jgi:hypothetical protein
MSNGIDMIAAERERQITEEGYTAEHDRDHAAELAWAARCYVENTAMGLTGQPTVTPGKDWRAEDGPDFQEFPWPWHRAYWKPTGDPVRDLTKAGALIAAAIDSLTAQEDGGH